MPAIVPGYDFHVPIAPSGLYWVVALEASQIDIDEDDDHAVLQVKDLRGIDEPNFPKAGPAYRANQSFRVKWDGQGDVTALEDPTKQFRIEGRYAKASGAFSVKMPRSNFSFEGSAEATYAFIGQETNGFFYTPS